MGDKLGMTRILYIFKDLFRKKELCVRLQFFLFNLFFLFWPVGHTNTLNNYSVRTRVTMPETGILANQKRAPALGLTNHKR